MESNINKKTRRMEVQENFPNVLKDVSNGIRISKSLIKIGIDRGCFYRYLTLHQKRLLKEANALNHGGKSKSEVSSFLKSDFI